MANKYTPLNHYLSKVTEQIVTNSTMFAAAEHFEKYKSGDEMWFYSEDGATGMVLIRNGKVIEVCPLIP